MADEFTATTISVSDPQHDKASIRALKATLRNHNTYVADLRQMLDEAWARAQRAETAEAKCKQKLRAALNRVECLRLKLGKVRTALAS